MVHIMAYIFQCTQTTKWKPSNLAVPEWEVQQFVYAQKEPHDMVTPHLFVELSKYACGDESCNQTMDDNPPTAPSLVLENHDLDCWFSSFLQGSLRKGKTYAPLQVKQAAYIIVRRADATLSAGFSL